MIIEKIGLRAIAIMEYLGGVAILGMKTAVWLTRPLTRHARVASHVVEMGLRTLPVSGTILLLIGMVIAFQTAYQVRALGGEVLIPGLLGISITRELGPVLTALVVAGRVGAAMTAEIGTMAVTEQIDAMDAMAVPPVRYLVAPRFIAMVIAMPILTIYTDVLGIFGGFIVCVGKLGLTPSVYVDSVTGSLSLDDIMTGLVKSVIFGMIICLVSCYQGMNVRGGAQGVGRSTMNSVVVSFLLVVLADFFFTLFFYLLPL